MLSDLQLRKFTRLFGALDVNGDGSIDAKDIDTVVERTGTESDGRATPESMERLSKGYRMWYGGIIELADHDRDGKVTLEEFIAFQEKMANDEALFEATIGAITPMTCSILDHDGDGCNDADDYVRFCRVHGIGDEGAAARWATLSSHRGGRMSVDDMRVVLHEFFRGNDASSPANDFLGKI